MNEYIINGLSPSSIVCDGCNNSISAVHHNMSVFSRELNDPISILVYTKQLINKLLSIELNYYTDVEFTEHGQNIDFIITYFVGGNKLSVSIKDNIVKYGDDNITVESFLLNPSAQPQLITLILQDLTTLNYLNT